MNETREKNPISFEWHAPEFEKRAKTKSWFIIPAIIAIVLGIIALATENILFLILILLGFFVFYIYGNKEPRIIKFEID
jgi:1,4-dihydroxy-2-naphthoate octaprenyltransferase